jgi:hypothetical protein
LQGVQQEGGPAQRAANLSVKHLHKARAVPIERNHGSGSHLLIGSMAMTARDNSACDHFHEFDADQQARVVLPAGPIIRALLSRDPLDRPPGAGGEIDHNHALVIVGSKDVGEV